MNLDEFQIEIRPADSGGFRMRARCSYLPKEDHFPFELHGSLDEIHDFVDGLESWVEDSIRGRLDRLPPDYEVQLSDMGRRLFECLFPRDLLRYYDRIVGNIEGRENQRNQKRGVRLRLLFRTAGDDSDINALLALPWESLIDPFNPENVLSRRRLTPVVRSLETPHRRGPLRTSPPLRILIAACQPLKTDPIDYKTEIEKIRQGLDSLPVNLEVSENPSFRELRNRLNSGDYHVLHFIGHGRFGEDTGIGEIAMTRTDGHIEEVSGESLAEHLNDCHSLRLVVLNTCHGATFPRKDGLDPYSGVAASLSRAGVPAVIAMQFPISSPAARVFAETFYKSLTDSDPVDTAVSMARKALKTDAGPLEWLTPVLFLSSEKSEIIRLKKEEDEEGEGALKLGIRFFNGGPSEGIEERNQETLDLREFFEERFIKEDSDWKSVIYHRLTEFLLKHARARRPLQLEFAAHWSIAFAAGYCLDAKSGLKISIEQRGIGGTSIWNAESDPSLDESGWKDTRDLMPATDGNDVALAIGVSRDILKDVEIYLNGTDLPLSRLVSATIDPKPGQLAVRDQEHAFYLAQQLEAKIRTRSISERDGVLHLFCSAPNALAFRLGQLARPFGRIQLYEHHFESGKAAAYTPSLALP